MSKPGDRARVITLAPGSLLTLRATCCVVEDGSWRALVDPGAFENVEEIEAALWPIGLSLADIRVVYFTHLHFDHYRVFDWPEHVEAVIVPRIEWEFANGLRELSGDQDAYLAALRGNHEYIAPVFLRQFWRFAKDKRYDFSLPEVSARLRLLEAGERLSPHVTAVNLPGHCPQLLALRVHTDAGLEIICADAVLDEEDFTKKRNRLIVHDAEGEPLARALLSDADIIHPGHGTAFPSKPSKPAQAPHRFATIAERSL